jgi:hypothetical protein
MKNGTAKKSGRGQKLGGGKIVNFTTAPVIADLWRRGTPAVEIDRIFRGWGVVTSARRLLGVNEVPLRPAHPKQERAATPLITARDVARHLVRRLGVEEWIVRDEHFREEVWRRDPHGVVFGKHLRLSFVIVMGMTERRVPEDLQHLYSAPLFLPASLRVSGSRTIGADAKGTSAND